MGWNGSQFSSPCRSVVMCAPGLDWAKCFCANRHLCCRIPGEPSHKRNILSGFVSIKTLFYCLENTCWSAVSTEAPRQRRTSWVQLELHHQRVKPAWGWWRLEQRRTFMVLNRAGETSANKPLSTSLIKAVRIMFLWNPEEIYSLGIKSNKSFRLQGEKVSVNRFFFISNKTV